MLLHSDFKFLSFFFELLVKLRSLWTPGEGAASPTMLGRTLTEVGGRAVNRMTPHLVNYASRARYPVETRLRTPGF